MLLITILLLITMGCCQNQIKPNNIAFNTGYGRDTNLGDVSNISKNDDYNISTFSVELIKDYKEWSKSLELSFIDHTYNYEDRKRLKHSNSFSVKIWAMRNFSLDYFDTFIGAGIGMGYTNPTKNNKYLSDSNITSDLGIRAGLQKTFKYFSIRVEYMFRHFSAIWKDDKGENLDEVRVGLIFPF